MSKHWRPDTNVVPLRPKRSRRYWARLQSYLQPATGRRLPDGARAGLVLVASACVGLAIGFYQVFGPRQVFAPGAEIEWIAGAAETIVAEVQPDMADTEWEGRAEGSSVIVSGREAIQDPGLPRRFTARNDGVRPRFGFCHTGGGTDCVVDGDTFYVDGDKVRIAGIDAPETHPPRCAYEARLGEQATAKLHELLNSGAVTMGQIDRDRDVYGRLLRNVAVDGRDVGEAMIAAGVARDYGPGRRGWC